MTVSKLKRLIKSVPQYKNFTLLEKPVRFNEVFLDKERIVQIHDVTPLSDLLPERERTKNDGIVGYSGSFLWKNNDIRPLDGDSYTCDFKVYGYHEFDMPGSSIKMLDVLAENW